MLAVILVILAALACVAAFGAWYNTQVISRDISMIKMHLGIEEKRKASFFDHDLDND